MFWTDALKTHVAKKPVAVLRLKKDDWSALRESRRGVGEFTIALPHAAFDRLQAPTLCLLLPIAAGEHQAYLGLIGASSAITTLQSRVKVRRAVVIQPASPSAFEELMEGAAYKRLLRDRLAEHEDLTVLLRKLSGHLIERLATLPENERPMRALASSLAVPRQFRGNGALQEDAIRTALKAFGLGSDDRALSLVLAPDQETALARVPIIEDGVIEHDARSLAGFDLVGSDMSGGPCSREAENAWRSSPPIGGSSNSRLGLI